MSIKKLGVFSNVNIFSKFAVKLELFELDIN